jgi:hypothetical protein
MTDMILVARVGVALANSTAVDTDIAAHNILKAAASG